MALCRDCIKDWETGEVNVCLLEAGHDTDPALLTPHRDGSKAWSRFPSGWYSWLDSTPVYA